MSAFVYCLYSTKDGLKEHVTAALEKAPGPLYDWMRETWRHGGEVNVYTLQEDIIPADLAMFEQYWIDQFEDLLNVVGNGPFKQSSAVAKQIITVIQSKLESERDG
jgi:hypothetical protein